MRRMFISPAVACCVAMFSATSASAQTVYDHLQCHKVKDAASFEATVDLDALATALPSESNCRVRIKARELCIPVAKTVTEIEGTTVNNEIVGADLVDDYLCYKVRCANSERPPAGIIANDQFGSRELRKAKAQTVCVPARKDCGTTNAPTCGGFCAGGLACTDQGGTCQCS